MYWDVKYVKPLPDYKIYVEVEDGRKEIFDMKPYCEKAIFLMNQRIFITLIK